MPGSLSDLVDSFENAKQKAALRMQNLDQVHKMLEGGYNNVPQPQDTEKYAPTHDLLEWLLELTPAFSSC